MVKNPPANAGDEDSIPRLGRPSQVGNGYPLQYSCLGKLKDRKAWCAIVHRVTKSWTCQGQKSLVCYSPQSHKELDMREQLNRNNKYSLGSK